MRKLTSVWGMVIGAGVGVALGSVFDEARIGLVLGAAVGLALGSSRAVKQ